MNKLYTDNSILQMEQDRLIRLRFISDEVIKKGQDSSALKPYLFSYGQIIYRIPHTVNQIKNR